MFNISIVTKVFFHPHLVDDPLLKARLRIMGRFGYFVMRDAQQSIRTAKSPAPPGKPPRNRKGTLKRNIRYAVELANNVVIGALYLWGLMIANRLEFGGDLRNQNRDSPVRTTTMPDHPFMQPAFDRQLAKNMPSMFAGCL